MGAEDNGARVDVDNDALRAMAERIATLEQQQAELIARIAGLHNRLTDLLARGEAMIEAMSENKFVQRMMMSARLGG